MDPHTRPRKSRTTSTNVHSASYVRIQVVVLKTYLGRWTIGRSGERGSGISVLPARYDDDDDDCSLSLSLSLSLCVFRTIIIIIASFSHRFFLWFSILPVPFPTLWNGSKRTNYDRYHRYPHVPQFFYFSGKIQEFISLLAFFIFTLWST